MAILLDSPVGPLSYQERDGEVIRLDWGDFGEPPDTPLAEKLADELRRYFDGSLTKFTVPIRPRDGFAAKFSKALCNIPYGDTKTYGDLAKELGVSAQAVGQACGANTIPIIVPCHRVLGASSLGGFSGEGGVEAKVTLLKLEGAAGLLI